MIKISIDDKSNKIKKRCQTHLYIFKLHQLQHLYTIFIYIYIAK
jgi:hypothetical protein